MKDLVLVESKSAREQYIGRVSVLDKVKVLPYLTKDHRSTVQQAAAYYEVPQETVQTILRRNRQEFVSDRIEVLQRQSLRTLVQDEHDLKQIPSLTLLPKRAMLRLGMLLTESEVATRVRNYLLNLEEISTQEQREWSLERELSKKRRRLMTDTIRDYIEESPNKRWRYVHFTELVYQKAFGKKAAELKSERRVKTDELLRDSFTTAELEIIEKAETFVSGLIMAGFPYVEIKAKINGWKLLVS